LLGDYSIQYIPELYAILKAKALSLPRDAMLRNQLKQAAVQILKQKDINFMRVENAIYGSITLAMIPAEDEVTGIDLEREGASTARQALVTGEEEKLTHWRRVARLIVFALMLMLLPRLVMILKFIAKLCKNAIIAGRCVGSSVLISPYLQFMQIMAALRMSLGH